MSKKEDERYQWFLDRIGKVVYRDENGCKCLVCKDSVNNGVLILDKDYADYLYCVEAETDIIYRDKK
jgi:hypothetical protein